MKDITPIICTYREALVYMWNTYFATGVNLKNDFNFEVDKSFSLIREGLFDSLVQAKIFDYSIPPNEDGTWEIYVIPENKTIKAIAGTQKGGDCFWEDCEIENEDYTFKFYCLFDWDQEGIMKGEFVRVKPSSPSLELSITDYLFRIEDVKFYIKTNANTVYSK